VPKYVCGSWARASAALGEAGHWAISRCFLGQGFAWSNSCQDQAHLRFSHHRHSSLSVTRAYRRMAILLIRLSPTTLPCLGYPYLQIRAYCLYPSVFNPKLFEIWTGKWVREYKVLTITSPPRVLFHCAISITPIANSAKQDATSPVEYYPQLQISRNHSTSWRMS
jgi:hypothetical protein